MPDFPKLPIITPPTNSFPELPIVTPDPPRLTLREKYGNFYYFGIAGLIVSLSLVFQFSYGLWASWDTWKAFFVLAHPLKPEAERIQAAWFLRHSPDINDAQRADIALRKELPTLGRYLVAEGLSPHAIQVDPKAYALMVAKSEGWPDWLRLLMARPMAYGVGEGYRFAWEALELLRQNPDPALALWATYTRAVMEPGDPPSAQALADSASQEGPFRELATLLEAASKASGTGRTAKLDEATLWLRHHHPDARKLWQGWAEVDGKLVEGPIKEDQSPKAK